MCGFQSWASGFVWVGGTLNELPLSLEDRSLWDSCPGAFYNGLSNNYQLTVWLSSFSVIINKSGDDDLGMT